MAVFADVFPAKMPNTSEGDSDTVPIFKLSSIKEHSNTARIPYPIQHRMAVRCFISVSFL